MAERITKRANYRVEKNPYDNEGVTLVYLNLEDDSEIGRENLSLYILLITGLKDLVLNYLDQLEIDLQQTSDRISAVSIKRKHER